MNEYLILGGTFSILAALLHIAIIIGGPDWYRFWGAGERMVVMAENGSWLPAILTFIIFLILFLWGLYAFSGAGLIKRLPFLKTALVLISLIYLIRGLSLVILLLSPSHVTSFLFWTSLVSFIVGVTYSFGTKQVWASISK
jgi:hypothetical protein